MPATARTPVGADALCLSVEETACTLRLAKSRVYELFASGELPFVKLGHRRLVERAELEKLIAKCWVPAGVHPIRPKALRENVYPGGRNADARKAAADRAKSRKVKAGKGP